MIIEKRPKLIFGHQTNFMKIKEEWVHLRKLARRFLQVEWYFVHLLV